MSGDDYMDAGMGTINIELQRLQSEAEVKTKKENIEASTGAKRDALNIFSMRTFPEESTAAACCAFEYGGEHYDFRNWEKGLPWQQLIDSTRRHLNNIERRHELDDAKDGSMLPEICVFMASATMLVTSMIRHVGEDNRLPEPLDIGIVRQPKDIARWMGEVMSAAEIKRAQVAEAKQKEENNESN